MMITEEGEDDTGGSSEKSEERRYGLGRSCDEVAMVRPWD
jgi:hypothetical protein